MAKSGYFSNMFTKVNNALLKNKSLRNVKNLYYYIDGTILSTIKKPKEDKSSKKKIIIIYNLSLGDGAMFNCALKNLRNIYPKNEYEITIACQKGLNNIYEATQIFDEVIPFNFTKGAVNLKIRKEIFKKLRSKKYDILLDPVGIEECSTNILMSRAVVADKKIGILNKGRNVTCPEKIYKKVYNQIIEINEPKMHLMDHYVTFLNKIGNRNDKPEFIDLPSKNISNLNVPEKYFIVYPSASTEYKRWPLDRFAEITKRMYKKLNIPLIVCGTNVDRETNDNFIELIKDEVKYIDLTGKTSILEYIELIKKAKYVVTNDTGIYHIAVVSQVPVTITAGAYTWDRYLTYNFTGHEKYKMPYIAAHKLDCANCDNKCIHQNEINKTWPCLDGVTVEDAWNKINQMISENN